MKPTVKTYESNYVTPEFILNYPYVFEPTKDLSGKENYSITMVFEVDEDLKQLASKVMGIAKTHFKVDPSALTLPLRNNKDLTENALKKNPIYKDKIIAVAKNKRSKPGVIRADKTLVEDSAKQEIYSGCICRASISIFAYEMGSSKGISFGLNHLVKIRDGEPLYAAGPSVFEAFDEVLETKTTFENVADDTFEDLLSA